MRGKFPTLAPGATYIDKMIRGIPTVKSSGDSSKAPRDSGRDEALAKARAAVEADNKQDAAEKIESSDQIGNADVKTDTANTVAESVKADVEATAGKKRAREEDGDEAATERETKKVDIKSEAVNGAS
jgi:hypothetical protein